MYHVNKYELSEFPKTMYLKHSPNQEIPSYLIERLRYLYLSLISIVETNIDYAHQLSIAFIKLSNEQNAYLPDHLLTQFCPKCFCVKIPGLTIATRLRKRSKKSKINLTTKKENRVCNELMVKCIRCQSILTSSSGFPRASPPLASLQTPSNDTNPKSPKPITTVSSNNSLKSLGSQMTNTTKPNSLNNNKSIGNIASQSKSGFSFLQKTPHKGSVTSNIGRLSGDFIPLGSAFTPKQSTSNSGQINLLELEMSNKKKKRRLSSD